MPKKRTIALQVNKLETSWPDYLLFYLLIRNNQNRQILGKNTRQIIWWRIVDCSLASDVWSVATWSDQSIKHNAMQIAVLHWKIMHHDKKWIMVLQSFILSLSHTFRFTFSLKYCALVVVSAFQWKVKSSETKHRINLGRVASAGGSSPTCIAWVNIQKHRLLSSTFQAV